MNGMNPLTNQSASHIVGENSVKVQKTHADLNKFKCGKLQAEYDGREARDVLISKPVGNNSTKVENNKVIILNHLIHIDLQAVDPDIARVPPSTLDADVSKVKVD